MAQMAVQFDAENLMSTTATATATGNKMQILDLDKSLAVQDNINRKSAFKLYKKLLRVQKRQRANKSYLRYNLNPTGVVMPQQSGWETMIITKEECAKKRDYYDNYDDFPKFFVDELNGISGEQSVPTEIKRKANNKLGAGKKGIQVM